MANLIVIDMPERFNFAALLDRPTFTSPASIFHAAENVFRSRLGTPLETMQLDYKTGRQSDRPWMTDRSNFPANLSPKELFFVYYTSLKRLSFRGTNISLHCPPNSATVTVSLEDIAIETEPDSVAQLCADLYVTCGQFAARGIVVAGSEVEINAESYSEALERIAYPTSLGKWVIGDTDTAEWLLSTRQFSVGIRTPDFILVQRIP